MPWLKNKLLFLLFFLVCSPFYTQKRSDSVNSNKINEVVLVGKNPISEKFSVVKIEKLDIYFNPVSKGDPLHAISILPASTNTDETANPVLRGGTADRTRVFINGAPVLNPVRNSQTNGLGNFSLLNTEIIGKQYVYASNPPLSYSNSSAGIIEIETNKNLSQENILVSAALSNFGMMINKWLSEKAFLQTYGNYQFSDALLFLNSGNLPNLKEFSSNDFGLNIRNNFSDRFSVNSFNYFINEKYASINNLYNYTGSAAAAQERFFTINNADYLYSKSKFRISTVFDVGNKNFNFGSIDSKSSNVQFMLSFSHKYRLSKKFTLQYGFDFFNTAYSFNEIKPLYFFALQKEFPQYKQIDNIDFNYSEIYTYADYAPSKKSNISVAFRKNILPKNQTSDFLSAQVSGHYNISPKNRFIFSMGQYHSYSTPNYFNHNIFLLKSQQIALDYYHQEKKLNISSAIYYKKDSGDFIFENPDSYSKINTFGIEISTNYDFSKNLSFSLANTYMNQYAYANNTKFNTSNNLKYFIKAQIVYNNPKYVTVSLSLIKRPGNFITSVSNAIWVPTLQVFQPEFDNINGFELNNYNKIDFSVNKVFRTGNSNSLITFLSINNILNNKNEMSQYYNTNYASRFYNFYQQRVFYFGLQYRINTAFK
ncbi:hypothetical protein SAMN05443429_10257 [Cruoricaptor ignavus]|uniref:Outer membrane receptor proteins, mostly Fe transport n=1 Tax=Cruoricaptor ignavus TaxID=1118202 RepID=A0A1M6BMX2_9FLAO|nr:hypothetical protein [Cruoricaptor ignavus]SHI49898.1 hypothetical protein SAMN05443429_10257 [Cruoricaptor ignavus]